jgi:capsular polysaccharide biosynthesis protein
MELRRYLQVCAHYWWLVALAFLATAASTIALVSSWETTYESSATVVVRTRFVEPDQGARAVDALIRGVTINTTYAEIADSRLVRDRAEARLSPEARQVDMSVTADVVTDTNIVTIRVRGPNADYAREFAAALSAETVAYVEGLTDIYRLEPLDPPTVGEPVDARGPLTIAVGLVLGLVLGVGLALLAEYLRGGAPRPTGGHDNGDEPVAPGGDGPERVEVGTTATTDR